jgi:hypothetical protein
VTPRLLPGIATKTGCTKKIVAKKVLQKNCNKRAMDNGQYAISNYNEQWAIPNRQAQTWKKPGTQ